ncbi:aldo/keto reductase [Xanthomonas hortorum]|uniref:aldo/keto reductase n=1 Tax=Xanthomonas hortorum TaxID=56454 RepID=UPI001E2CA563|nr:aldo/keto reductase [Xanthomonas hortorum]MCC8495803.1 aldo/keto reductase [Xanthomonas hortorum pv. gardneri]MCE4530226.1 aldo/keto reductase [Xanthomonas hortorum pv. vitians]
MSAHPHSLTLNNGVQLPALGLGVYQSSPDDTVGAVATSLRNGYRMIDTAAAYGNEREVGEGIVRSGIDRDALFVTTKLWISDYGYDQTLRAFDVSLRKLALDHLDMYLLHWPVPMDFEGTLASWRAAERLLSEGRVRAIGVCNFSPAHLEQLRAHADIVPAVNQIELHPYFSQQPLRDYHAQHGIVTQAWSPLGGVNVYAAPADEDARNILTHPTVVALAIQHRRTPAQIVLRWHLEHGTSVIPKSVNPERIIENSAIFDFKLGADVVARIDAIHDGRRGGPDPELVSTQLFAATIPD